ncbi:hypothetical protein EDB85DRAFT_1944083 [Lactarius pseudohatsudake]|nr:hypothetical protein EDB85DRAFT_1944083 [Lactarius pseudohatsudake]
MQPKRKLQITNLMLGFTVPVAFIPLAWLKMQMRNGGLPRFEAGIRLHGTIHTPSFWIFLVSTVIIRGSRHRPHSPESSLDL